MIDFKPVEIEDLNRLTPFLRRYGSSSCQHAFVSMLGLKEKYMDEFCFISDILYVHRLGRDHDGYRVYLAPIGEIRDFGEALSNIVSDAHERGFKVSFETICEDFKEVLCNISDDFEITYDRDYSEYIYSVDNMSVLPGRALAPKRNRIRAFYSDYEGHIRIENINKDNIEAVKVYQSEWLAERKKTLEDSMLDTENKAVSLYLNHFEEFGFKGIVVSVYGKIVGYAAGFPLSEDTMDETIEKGSRNITGIYQLLCNEFAVICCKDYRYINREEDIGLPGLRRAKESYCPVRMIDKYIAKEK